MGRYEYKEGDDFEQSLKRIEATLNLYKKSIEANEGRGNGGWGVSDETGIPDFLKGTDQAVQMAKWSDKKKQCWFKKLPNVKYNGKDVYCSICPVDDEQRCQRGIGKNVMLMHIWEWNGRLYNKYYIMGYTPNEAEWKNPPKDGPCFGNNPLQTKWVVKHCLTTVQDKYDYGTYFPYANVYRVKENTRDCTSDNAKWLSPLKSYGPVFRYP